MLKIKFSHDYPKLWGQKWAQLLAVRIIDAASVGPDLVDYDTITSNGEYYELPKTGKLIQLVFLGDKGIPFCTLRRYTPEKLHYYVNAVSKGFNIEGCSE